MIQKPAFGPGGNSLSFYAEGHKSTSEAPAFVASKGLDAYEYEAGRGIMASEASLLACGKNAREAGILMSLHAPYFISLSGENPETRLKSVEYIRKSLRAAELLGADTVVIHCGGTAKMPRSEAFRLMQDTMEKVLCAVGDTPIHLGMETMGKVNQLGTLEEVIELCRMDGHLYPVVDFGHLNARYCGGYYTDADSYRRTFGAVAEALGDEKARFMHCHFSKIEYTAAGEKKHLTFADSAYGPAFEPLCEAIARDGLCPRIICESDGTMTEDAAAMKQYLQSLII